MENKLFETGIDYKPTVLMILDGWGHREDEKGNATLKANTPFLDKVTNDYPWCLLKCSGEEVGLPKGYMGNSEVGHLNIGAGRVVHQDFKRINNAISDGSFYKLDLLEDVYMNASSNNKKVHLIGLLSDGGVHSHIDHFKAFIKFFSDKKFNNLYVHPIFDGRDTAPMIGDTYVNNLYEYFKEFGVGKIGSISGRFYAMDRDTRWDRVKRAYDVLTKAEPSSKLDIIKYIKESHAKGVGDEFIEPMSFDKDSIIEDGDSVIFVNFRSDRARQISKAFIKKDFDGFKRDNFINLYKYVCMTRYDDDFNLPVLFPPEDLKNILGEVISKNNLKQLRIAETEKYAHVTFFFNGGEEKKFPKENRILIDSPRDVPTYDYKPEMSAKGVSDKLVSVIEKGIYDFIVVNFANCDMVGHTGKMDAAIKAVETADKEAKKVVEAVLEEGGMVFITADHGNSEQMEYEDGSPHTAHTTNPVKFVFVNEELKHQEIKFIDEDKKLADIAPTILEFMDIEKPKEMTGKSMVEYFCFDTSQFKDARLSEKE